MATVDNKYAGTVVSGTGWNVFTTAVLQSDDGGPGGSNRANSTSSSYVVGVLRNFDFSSLPDGATINGITVNIQLLAGAFGTAYARCALSHNAGTNYTSYATEVSTAERTTDQNKSFGGSSDTWGRSWTASEIKDTSNFYVKIETKNDSSSYAYVDYLWVTVDYTEGGGSTLTKSLYDNLALSTALTPLIPSLFKTLFDNIAASTAITQRIPLLSKSVFDNIAISDYAQRYATLSRLLVDNIGISDNLSKLIPVLVKSVFDTLAISDSASGVIPVLSKSIFDVVTAGEDIIPVVISGGILMKILTDSIAIGDDVDSVIPTLSQVLFDNIAISDEISRLIPVLYKQLIDNLSVSDYSTGFLPVLYKEVYDTIFVGEGKTTSLVNPSTSVGGIRNAVLRNCVIYN